MICMRCTGSQIQTQNVGAGRTTRPQKSCQALLTAPLLMFCMRCRAPRRPEVLCSRILSSMKSAPPRCVPSYALLAVWCTVSHTSEGDLQSHARVWVVMAAWVE